MGDMKKLADSAEVDETRKRSENEPVKGFMFIGELAKETGVDPKTIRFYERAGLLSPPRHGRFRTYMDSDVRRLKFILMMRRLGIGIAQIHNVLEANKDATGNEFTANLLFNHLETLRTREAEVAKQLEATTNILLQFKKDPKISL